MFVFFFLIFFFKYLAINRICSTPINEILRHVIVNHRKDKKANLCNFRNSNYGRDMLSQSLLHLLNSLPSADPDLQPNKCVHCVHGYA